MAERHAARNKLLNFVFYARATSPETPCGPARHPPHQPQRACSGAVALAPEPCSGAVPLAPEPCSGAVALGPVLFALAPNRLAQWVFYLSHVFDGPVRYGASIRFDTMPSSLMRQTCSNTVAPSCAKCSLKWMACLALPSSSSSCRLRSSSVAQVVALMLDQVESEQYHIVVAAAAAQGLGVG
jgi:hypothetical protein